jgi:hypothetical protein
VKVSEAEAIIVPLALAFSLEGRGKRIEVKEVNASVLDRTKGRVNSSRQKEAHQRQTMLDKGKIRSVLFFLVLQSFLFSGEIILNS